MWVLPAKERGAVWSLADLPTGIVVGDLVVSLTHAGTE